MTRTHLNLRLLATVLVAGILVPVYGRAQTVRGPGASVPLTVIAQDEARALDQLFVTASASYYAGQRAQARRGFEQAADRALQLGDLKTAVRSLLNAAIIANEQRDPERDELIARAYRLTASPLLSEAQKDQIRNQFYEVKH